MLQDWMFNDYQAMKQEVRSIDSPGQDILNWQQFESFIASIRCLKSRVFQEGAQITIRDIHHGADLGPNSDRIHFTNRHLTLVRAVNRIPTDSTHQYWACPEKEGKYVKIKRSFETINAEEGKHCIINGGSASAGDYFEFLDDFTETGQGKDYSDETKLDQTMFDNERAKAASEKDFFILYTTKHNCEIIPGERSGIVHGDN